MQNAGFHDTIVSTSSVWDKLEITIMRTRTRPFAESEALLLEVKKRWWCSPELLLQLYLF